MILNSKLDFLIEHLKTFKNWETDLMKLDVAKSLREAWGAYED